MQHYLKQYLIRMMIFLSLVAGLAGILYASLIQAFLNSPWLNGAILLTLFAGIYLIFHQLKTLNCEQTWLTAFERGEENFPGSPPVQILTPLAVAHSQGPIYSGAIPSLLSSIETRLDEQRDFNRYLVGLLIFLGLLGTFWGLSQTIGAIAGVVSGIDVGANNIKEAFQTLKQGLQSPLSGMGTAFSSSMFGLASSLILGFLDLQLSKANGAFFNRVEEKLLRFVEHTPVAHSGKAYNLGLAEQNAEGIAVLQRLVRTSEENRLTVIQAITALTERLALLTEHLNQQHQSLTKLSHHQSETLEQLKQVAKHLNQVQGENVRDYLRNLDGLTRKLLDEMVEGRNKSLQELRSEIRLVARTISALAEGQEAAA
jgi:hypothetical protein